MACDRLVGDRGNDTMNGGDGDDTLVWNNGDGSDVINGDAGDDRVENNLSAGPDVSTLKNENGRVRYDRTNVGQFNLSMATVEVFELNTLRRRRRPDRHPRRHARRSTSTAATATTR